MGLRRWDLFKLLYSLVMFIEVAEGPSMDTQVDVVMIFPIDTLNFQQGKGVHTTLVLAILRVSDRPLGDGKCW